MPKLPESTKSYRDDPIGEFLDQFNAKVRLKKKLNRQKRRYKQQKEDYAKGRRV